MKKYICTIFSISKKYIRIYPALKLGNERFFYFCNGCKKLGGLTLITAATAEFFLPNCAVVSFETH